jgi:hypothetical protein
MAYFVLILLRLLSSWRWTQKAPTKRRQLFKNRKDVIHQKTWILTNALWEFEISYDIVFFTPDAKTQKRQSEELNVKLPLRLNRYHITKTQGGLCIYVVDIIS